MDRLHYSRFGGGEGGGGWYDICRIIPYTSDKNVEYVKYWELIIYNVTLEKHQLYTYVFTINIGTKYYNSIYIGTLTRNHLHLQTRREIF